MCHYLYRGEWRAKGRVVGERPGKAAIRFLLCAGASIGLGYLLVGERIFQPELVSFQFVMSGLIVGLLVAATEWLPRRRIALVAAGVYFLILVVNKVEDPDKRVSFAVYVLVLYLGTMGGLLSNRWFPRLYFGKFVLWAALFGALHLVSVPFLGLVLAQSPDSEMMLASGQLGAAMGAAAGMGFELSQYMEERKKAPRGALD